MAEVRPFRALRFDPSKLRLDDVVTQPYDKITPEMQQKYYERHAANFIRFELPRHEGDVYESARQFLADMRGRGLIRLDQLPGFYVYEQEFEHPLQPGRRYRRQALIGLGRLHDYGEGIIFRHEQTLSGPKEDREHLLRTTKVQSGLLFLMYDDPSRCVEKWTGAKGQVVNLADDLGIRQRIWPLTDPETIRAIQECLRDKKLVLADGHHRYETALANRRSRDGKYAEDFAMLALVNTASEGLLVLPTHRVVFGLPVDRVQTAINTLQREQKITPTADAAGDLMNRGIETAVGIVTPDGQFLFQFDRAQLQRKLECASCELDVEVLQALFEKLLGITPEDVAEERHVRYHRYAQDAVRDVKKNGGQAAFLIRPVPIDVIFERSYRGALMPQKSTDFYPKMISGLTLYSWDESFAGETAPKGVTA